MKDFLQTDIPRDQLMLLNIQYIRPSRETDYKDYLYIIYKDLRDNSKHLQTIVEPEVEIYFTKQEYRTYEYNRMFERLDHCDCHIVKYKNLANYIAEQAGPAYVNMIKECKNTGRYSAIKNIHKYPYVFGSDLDIEILYKIYWQQNYSNDTPKHVSTMFFDIETDIIDIVGFPKDGNCPIFMNTVIDVDTKSVFTMLLRNPDNPLIDEFEEKVKEFVQSLHDDFDESYGEFEYKIFMYDREIDLIKDFFRLINMYKRDFVVAWNGNGFDFPFIYDRLVVLGYDPSEIMTNKDFEVRSCYYKRDTRNFKVDKKKDFIFCTSYSILDDQMQFYAKNRKAGGALRSVALNTVAEETIGDKKLDYSSDSNMKYLPYTGQVGTPKMKGNGYATYVRYNIKDVMLQYGIDSRTNDIDTVYSRAMANVIDYRNNFSQTKFLQARAYLEYMKQGLIIGNNMNVTYGSYDEKGPTKKEQKFAGALVADPENNDYCGMEIFGLHSKYVFTNVIDFDFSSLYPSIIITFNIAPNCLIGKLIINESVSDLVTRMVKAMDKANNPDKNDEDELVEKDEFDDDEQVNVEYKDDGGEFIEDLITNNISLVGNKWFNLPNLEDIIKELEDEDLI